MIGNARRALVAAVCCAAAVALAGCGDDSGADGSVEVGGGVGGGDGGGSGGAPDRMTYDTIDALTEEADVVVLGAVGEVRGTEIDDGGNGDDNGLEVTFTSVAVDEVLSGRATTVQAGDVLPVGVTAGSTELSEGSMIVLFLDQLTPADAPGIDTEEVFYVIIGSANGAFDVQDGAVIARTEDVRGMATAAPIEGPFTTSLDDLRAYFHDR